MSEIQRYDRILNYRCGEPCQDMEEVADGDYVLYTDYLAALAEKDALLEHRDRSMRATIESLDNIHTAQIAALTTGSAETQCPQCGGIGTFSQEGCVDGEYKCKCGFIKKRSELDTKLRAVLAKEWAVKRRREERDKGEGGSL
jgi:predicted RNA-binding Zn-ribbon protein involved in translation (DUF1610 family)